MSAVSVFTSVMVLVFALAIGFVILAAGLCRAAARPAPQIAAPSTASQSVAARATRCTVPFCDDPVQVFIPVGIGDTWTFCMTHGLPYLTAESAQQRKGGAA